MEVLITLTFTNNTSYRNKISSDDKSLDEIVDDVSNIFKSNKISKIANLKIDFSTEKLGLHFTQR